MCEYVLYLNRDIPQNDNVYKKVEDIVILEYAKKVAWECVRENLFPMSTHKKNKKIVDNENDSDNLEYLENKLHIVKTISPGDRIRFTLDTLAEYLAALFLIDKHEKELWTEFYENAKKLKKQNSNIDSFLNIVMLCIKEKNISNTYEDDIQKLNELLKTTTIAS